MTQTPWHVPRLRMHVIVGTVNGCRPTGLTCYPRHAASFSPLLDKSRSSRIHLRRRGPGSMRRTRKMTAPSSSIYGLTRDRVSMLIAGEWKLRDDGVMRPIVRARVLGSDGSLVAEDFLIDSGADRTVLSATLLARLPLLAQ